MKLKSTTENVIIAITNYLAAPDWDRQDGPYWEWSLLDYPDRPGYETDGTDLWRNLPVERGVYRCTVEFWLDPGMDTWIDQAEPDWEYRIIDAVRIVEFSELPEDPDE